MCKDCCYLLKTTRLSSADYRTVLDIFECRRHAPPTVVNGQDWKRAYWPEVDMEKDCCGEGVLRVMPGPVDPDYIPKPMCTKTS